ncbi:MAG: type III-A CRISPR-associated protein Csm2 [Candidatus Woesearchaeota archaeon]
MSENTGLNQNKERNVDEDQEKNILFNFLNGKEVDYLNYFSSLEKKVNSWNVTKNQIRKLYDIVVDFKDNGQKSDIVKALYRLRIQLEYSYRRKVIKKEDFYKFMKEMIELVLKDNQEIEKKFQRFMNIFEGIVAFSKD